MNESEARSDELKPDQLSLIADQFSARIEGLRELLEVISPHVALLDRPEGIQVAIDRSGLSGRGKRLVGEMLLSGVESENDEEPESRLKQVGQESDPGAESIEMQRILEFAELARNEPSGLLKIFRRLTQGSLAPRASLLHGSLLTVAVASFEFLLAGIYSEHLIRFPKQLNNEEKEFSLSDLVELGSIEEARRVLTERRVDGFMRRDIKDWSAWSERTLGQSFSGLCLDFTHLNEVFQRRHIVVHGGGIVSRLYLERVDLPTEEGPKLGDELPVSSAYMQSALDELEVLGYGLVALARSRWDPATADEASDFLNLRIYFLLKSGRFSLARKLAEVGGTLGQSAAMRWTITVNGWIAAKRLGEFDQCRDEIAAWDVSALADEFKLAKACLLGEDDKAFDLLAISIQASATKPGEIWDWPLLDDLRAHPRFAETFLSVGYTPPDQSTDSLEPG